jgi:FKBP-type peptidyl-prolyl cis-trans isomerase FkpA
VNRSSVARAVAALALLFAGLALPVFAAGPKPETEEQKVLYAIGSAMTRTTERMELTEAEVEELLKGLSDGLAGKARMEKPEEFGPLFESFVATRMEEIGKREKTAADAFLAEAAGAQGATKAENGMVFLEQAAGAGEPPKVDDIIEVHYVGSLRDGKVFDSSRERGAPETIQLANTIECWKQALPKMRPGGRALVTCPSEIAFGERGTDTVRPGAALRFEIELIKVVR